MIRLLVIIAICFGFIANFSGASHSALIKKIEIKNSNGLVTYAISLEGEIQEGDYSRLRTLFNQNFLNMFFDFLIHAIFLDQGHVVLVSNFYI